MKVGFLVTRQNRLLTSLPQMLQIVIANKIVHRHHIDVGKRSAFGKQPILTYSPKRSPFQVTKVKID